MNVWNFKLITALFIFVAFSEQLSAQKMKFLIPDGVTLQHAGSIGYLSGGVNYQLFRNGRASLDVLYGHVPESKGGSFSTLSTKFAYRPLEFKVKDWLVVYPVNPGAFLSYTINKDFDLTWDRDQYPKKYYYWSEALHVHLSFNSEVKLNTPKLLSSKKIEALTLYYEVNTNEMYLVNYFQNTRSISIADIFKAGIGIKASF